MLESTEFFGDMIHLIDVEAAEGGADVGESEHKNLSRCNNNPSGVDSDK